MGELRHGRDEAGGPSLVSGVVVPIVLLLIVIAVVAGLVGGGVVQGDAPRVGPEGSTSTESTIVIEP